MSSETIIWIVLWLAISGGLLVYSKSLKLGLMMWLQFFVWGAWYTTVGNFMGSVGMTDSVYLVYSMNSIAAIVAPFFLGLIADRYFASEKVLAVLHLLGAAFMFLAPWVAESTGSAPLFIGIMLLYNLCYMPTLGLANALAFHHIEDQENQFPKIRVLGTVGWIVAGVVVSQVMSDVLKVAADATHWPLYITAAMSLVMGVYAFFLPHTPPPAAGKKATVRDIIGLDAFAQLGSRSFYVFIAASLLMCIPLAAYYAYAPVFILKAGIQNPGFQLTFGQASEVIFMVLMPFFFRRLGVKWMLGVGMLAWTIRYGLFAAAAPSGIFWMIMTGIVLHGICYDFFFVTGQIYVDKRSNEKIRGQAQGFLVLVTYGVGMFIGNFIAGILFNWQVGEAGTALDWQTFWFIPAGAALVVMVLFVLIFKDDSEEHMKNRMSSSS